MTELLRKMVDNQEIEPIVVDVLIEHFDVINEARIQAQQKASQEYEEFQRLLQEDV